MSRVCLQCEQAFEPTRPNQKQRFCCGRCRNKYWNRVHSGRPRGPRGPRAAKPRTGPRTDRIPVAPVREAVERRMHELRRYERGDLFPGAIVSWSSLASCLWGPRPDKPTGDSTRVRRALGILPYTPTTAGPRYTQTINCELAARIIRAVGLDPCEVEGL